MNERNPQSVTKPREHYEARAKVAKALAHPSRLLILDLLGQHEMCVQDLTHRVGSDQSTISKHLASLKVAGLVESRREGTSHYYHLTCACLDDFFHCLETVVQQDAKKKNAAACHGECNS